VIIFNRDTKNEVKKLCLSKTEELYLLKIEWGENQR